MEETLAQAALHSWDIPPAATLVILVTAILYLRGWNKIRKSRPHQFPLWRMGCFLGGLVSLWIALASALDTLNGVLLVAHMTQHLILMSVTPPLLLLGAPAVPLLRGLPRSLVRDGFGPLFRAPLLRRLFYLLTHRVFAWFAMNIAYVAWHIPQAYELALRSESWHDTEHACFFVTGLLFWFPIIQPWPSVSRGSGWVLLPYLVGADLVNTVVAASLTFASTVLYPSYLGAAQRYGISALGDQAAAGALMWVIGSILYLVPLAAIAIRLLSPQSSRHYSAYAREAR